MGPHELHWGPYKNMLAFGEGEALSELHWGQQAGGMARSHCSMNGFLMPLLWVGLWRLVGDGQQQRRWEERG